MSIVVKATISLLKSLIKTYSAKQFRNYKPIPLFKEHVLVSYALDWQKFNWHKSHRQNGDRQKSNWQNGNRQLTHNHPKQHTLLFSFFSMSTHKVEFPLQFVPLASISINHLLAKHPVLRNLPSSIPPNKRLFDSMFATI